MQRARSSNLFAAVAVVAAAGAACGRSQTREAAAPESASTPAAAADPERFDSPLELVPAGAYLVLAGASPAAVAEAFGWDALRDRAFGDLAAQVESQLGRDLLSLSGLEELGVATDAPFGLAVVPGERDAAVLFARLASPDHFASELAAIASKRGEALEHEDRGAATVMVTGDGGDVEPRGDLRTRFVVRGEHVLIIEGAEVAEAIATISASESLAASPAYRRAMEAAGGDRGHVFGFVDPAAFLARKVGGPYGPPPPVRAAIDQIGFAGVGFSAEVRGREVALALGLPAREESPPAALKTGRGARAITRALVEPPLALAHLQLDVEAVLRRVEQVAGAGALARGKAMAGQAFSVDIDEELVPLLTGELGVAWTGSASAIYGDAAGESDGPPIGAFDLHVTLGVRDTDAAAELLDRVAQSPLVESLLEPRDDGGYELAVPSWKSIHIDARAGAIAATTEPAFLERLHGDDVDSYVADAEPDSRRALLMRDDSAALLSVTMESLALLVLGGPIDPRGMNLDHPAPGPKTPAYREKRRQLEEADAKLEEAVAAARAAQRDLLEILRDYGSLTVALRAEPDLLAGEGGQFAAEGSTLASVLVRHVEANLAFQRSERQAFELASQRMRILHELEALKREGE